MKMPKFKYNGLEYVPSYLQSILKARAAQFKTIFMIVMSSNPTHMKEV